MVGIHIVRVRRLISLAVTFFHETGRGAAKKSEKERKKNSSRIIFLIDPCFVVFSIDTGKTHPPHQIE